MAASAKDDYELQSEAPSFLPLQFVTYVELQTLCLFHKIYCFTGHWTDSKIANNVCMFPSFFKMKIAICSHGIIFYSYNVRGLVVDVSVQG
jgi:hypothetical protein